MIQRVFRKRLERKIEQDKLYIEQRRIAYDILDELIQEYLQESFIPTILLEIFTCENDSFDPESKENQLAYYAYEEIQRETVNTLLFELVTNVSTQMVEDYLRKKADASGNNPMITLVDRLVNGWLHELTHELVVEGNVFYYAWMYHIY